MALLKPSQTFSLTDLMVQKQEAYPKNWAFKPLGVEIELTFQCNLRCEGCAVREDVAGTPYKLTASEVIGFLAEAQELGLFFYSLTGGEPFLCLSDIKQIISASSLDILKINTNGFIFSSREKSGKILEELITSGFGKKNNYLNAWINMSIGQQTRAGIPLDNALYLFTSYQAIKEKADICISYDTFSLNQAYSEQTLRQLKERIIFEFGDNSENEVIYKLISSDCVSCSTALNLGIQSPKVIKVVDAIKAIAQPINCSPIEKLAEAKILAPRLLLRANGDLFTCFGFNHNWKLGNIRKNCLKEMLTKANSTEALTVLFSQGIPGLLSLIEKYNTAVSKQMVSTSYGSCDLCKLLQDNLPRSLTLGEPL